ncbi:GrpB family protein [Methanosarcina horonobensis]|uniref:GrpB family protein n=1 Tax=Methanosarcina horonobensis TaxID=418008 RepID=UPI000AA1EF41|nr:GrpB family protein [Methanosarcina horonobensis]
MSIGLKRNTVILESFSSEWGKYFELEKERILGAVGDKILTIEHVGSTSIKSSVAKPIIDICIGISNYSAGFEFVKGLEDLGYKYLGERGVEGRHYFLTDSDCVKVHIHMFDLKSDQYLNHILFRDYLNCHPEDLKKIQ